MKRLVLAVLAAGLTYALALASAATLNVQNSSLGSGSGAASSCDPDVATSYTTTYNPGGYVVTQVVVTALDTAACNGKAIGVTLTDNANASLGTGTATVPSTGTSVTVPIGGTPPAAAAVAKAFVVIG